MCADQQEKGVFVRACRKEDLSEAKEILESSPEAGHWSVASLEASLQEHKNYFLSALQNEHIAGFIVGRRIAEEGEILNVAVKFEFRRKGMGKALVQAVLEVFRSEGVARVFLEVRESNAPAIAMYENLGFQEIGKRPGYYRDPNEAALVLALEIGTVSTYR